MGQLTQVGLGFHRIEDLVGADMGAVLAMARRADEAGIDYLTFPDHVALSADAVKDYPLGAENFPTALDAPWLEPLTMLAAVAGCTKRIRLSTDILIGPIRPAVLLAKQLATLDVVSGGRVHLALGAGWQRQEFEGCGMPFEGRLGHLEEEITAIRLLWREAPASFAGKHVNFRNLYSLPHPVQKGGIPILLGVSPSPRNCARIARLADGWIPDNWEADKIARDLAPVHEALRAVRRDPEGFEVRAALKPIHRGDGSLDLDATTEGAAALVAAGVTAITAVPAFLCRHRDEVAELIDRMVALRQ